LSINGKIEQWLTLQQYANIDKLTQDFNKVKGLNMATINERLLEENYTTEQIALAVGRMPEQWSRIRHRYIAKYDLKVIRVGRRNYYNKETVDNMIEELLENGDG
jgi:hypothetical protein